jgi:hypothetical protein
MGSRMKTTVELPDQLLIEAKKHAAEYRTTIRSLIERGLRHELGQKATARKPKPAIKWVTVPGGPPKGLDVSDRETMMGWLLRDRA